uniref:SFRICE_021916 n=1 Tax=Spodoptera frugiperda TaxID=7108 RepID=A0A2H1VVR8_SPOFR
MERNANDLDDLKAVLSEELLICEATAYKWPLQNNNTARLTRWLGNGLSRNINIFAKKYTMCYDILMPVQRHIRFGMDSL